jgi:hypothetical protein
MLSLCPWNMREDEARMYDTRKLTETKTNRYLGPAGNEN